MCIRDSLKTDRDANIAILQDKNKRLKEKNKRLKEKIEAGKLMDMLTDEDLIKLHNHLTQRGLLPGGTAPAGAGAISSTGAASSTGTRRRAQEPSRSTWSSATPTPAGRSTS